jgi:hypothetical protein
MRRLFSAVLVLLSSMAACCYGDGGAVIARQTIEGLQLTVFASPAPLRAGPVDVSVLVQKGEKPVLDADVDISWRANSDSSADWLPPCCTMESRTERIPALRGHSNNRFLYSAIVPMKTAGPSVLGIRVLEAGREVLLSCDIDVRRPLPPLLAFWPWLVSSGPGQLPPEGSLDPINEGRWAWNSSHPNRRFYSITGVRSHLLLSPRASP